MQILRFYLVGQICRRSKNKIIRERLVHFVILRGCLLLVGSCKSEDDVIDVDLTTAMCKRRISWAEEEK